MNRMHPYHQVDPSPWPIIMSQAVQGGAVSVVSKQTHMTVSQTPAIIQIQIISVQWWRDVIREGIGGYHTYKVQQGLIIGFLQFLVSEIMLFASFFWAFFHSSLSPAIEQGNTWPPIGINAVNPWGIPLQGSCVLQVSGFVVTQSHHATIAGNKKQALFYGFITVFLGICFLGLQLNEYRYGEFTVADSVFGSVFYATTGLHALHVIMGVQFLIVGYIRLWRDSFTSEHLLGQDLAIWYYHLVDIVWLALFFIYYVWGT